VPVDVIRLTGRVNRLYDLGTDVHEQDDLAKKQRSDLAGLR
jgi:hypothetical protein